MLELEEIASEIRVFAPALIPGLLQTDRYQQAVLDVAPGLPMSRAARQIQVRAKRQALRTGQNKRLTAVLSEAALQLQVGGPEIMAEEIDYLLGQNALQHTKIRYWPFAAGAHPGGRGEFTLMTFPPEEAEPPFSYSEGYQGTECSEDAGVISQFEERWEIITEKSISIEEFR